MPESPSHKQSLAPKSTKAAKKLIKKTNRMVLKERFKAGVRRAVGKSAQVVQKLVGK